MSLLEKSVVVIPAAPTAVAPEVLELLPFPDVMDAVRALHGLPQLMLLESAAIRAERGRYSFLMADPCRGEQLPQATLGTDPFQHLRDWSQEFPSLTVPGLPPFQGGVAGLLSYELGQSWERLPPTPAAGSGMPALAAGLYPWVIAWDHIARRAWIIAHGWPEKSLEQRQQFAIDTVRRLARRLTQPGTPASSSHVPSAPLPNWAVEIAPGVWSDFSKADYLAAVQRVIDNIYAGDIFQANMTQRLLMRATLPAVDLYERLRRCNPAPFAGFYQHDDWAILSASPERFLSIEGGVVTTRPIKGTRRRSSQAEADLYTRDSLRQSEKDQAENVMIVDLLRNDLSRVCRPGTVRVPHLCEVETFSTVQHLVSEIQGTLTDGCSAWDVFAASFPGGSITGAPKVRAMEIIAELERTARGPYTGSLFYVGHNGVTDSNLLIRTFVLRDGWLQCGVGGGVVAQSDPAGEYAETWHKAAAMLQALGLRGNA